MHGGFSSQFGRYESQGGHGVCAHAESVPPPLAEQIMAITLAAVTVSIVLHGITVRPMMLLYWRWKLR